MTFDISTTDQWMRGSITALVTPFHHGAVDYKTYQKLIARQIEGGTSAIVPVGTTGETSTLSEDEHVEVIRCAVEASAGRIPVIAGVGSNNTATSIMLAEQSVEAGADGLLAVTGYYNKPSQDGLIAHFMALADATDLPMILYNVPGRTSCDISVRAMAVLARHPRIVAVKDATGNLARVAQQRLACGANFIQLSGEDATAVGFNAMGGVGCISVTANVVPDLCAQLQQATLDGDWGKARDLQDRLTPLSEALFTDTSPAPVKYALARLGLCQEELRLPLVPASENAKIAVLKALEDLGLVG